MGRCVCVGGWGGGGGEWYLSTYRREIRVALPDKIQQPQEHRHPFLSVCAAFPFVQTMVAASVWDF